MHHLNWPHLSFLHWFLNTIAPGLGTTSFQSTLTACRGLNAGLQKNSVCVLIPRNLFSYLIKEWPLPYMATDKIKLRILREESYPCLSGWVLYPTNVLTRDRQRKVCPTEEEAMWPGKQRLKGCGHKSRNTNSHQKLEEIKNGMTPEPPEGAKSCWIADF